ncbi:hypothetical protein [Empedobacter tilapiae]|uniref:Uncharacterized protein n=1 Tax=Empedobacter tilapiae TaxID=2491114 RepID=A0A4Z1BM17_9FLAO|nr:hypothetical protein [Empedobacter tilapiae]TGN23115.1 hypothetical protein E4J94_15360 [Empedobacter tilapiae]
MKTFNIKKFEENKGNRLMSNQYWYTLENYDVREFSFDDTNTNTKIYQRVITKEFNPFKSYYYYYDNGIISKKVLNFNNSTLTIKEYNRNGELVKETDFDKNFKHSFEQIHDFVLKEKNIDIYDTRQAVALRHDTPHSPLKKYYQIHVLKSSFVDGQWYSQPNYSFLIADETGQIVKSSEKK